MLYGKGGLFKQAVLEEYTTEGQKGHLRRENWRKKVEEVGQPARDNLGRMMQEGHERRSTGEDVSMNSLWSTSDC